jgi:hypothetical protein
MNDLTAAATKLFPAKSMVLLFTAMVSLSTTTIANSHNTKVIQADIIGIEPIYMNYTLTKISTPCASGARNCWNVSYKKKASKVLKGYRVKLAYYDNTFTARMQKKPTDEYLKIRVKSDLLTMPSTVAINGSVVY